MRVSQRPRGKARVRERMDESVHARPGPSTTATGVMSAGGPDPAELLEPGETSAPDLTVCRSSRLTERHRASATRIDGVSDPRCRVLEWALSCASCCWA